MKTANFQYKCRRCGKMYTRMCGGEHRTSDLFEILEVMEKGSSGRGSQRISSYDVHSCHEDAMGIADFVGVEYTKE